MAGAKLEPGKVVGGASRKGVRKKMKDVTAVRKLSC